MLILIVVIFVTRFRSVDEPGKEKYHCTMKLVISSKIF